MRSVALVGLALKARGRRLAVLAAFAAVFVAAAIAVRLLTGGAHGHVELDPLFLTGGYPLVSALLLLGWVLGRFPLIATLVLVAGLVSDDRARGYARIYAVRPTSPILVYGVRLLVLLAAAFALSAILLPTFDLIMLGEWAGPATLVLILAYVLVYGGLTAFLSVWTRADAWITLLLAVTALVWDALRSAGRLATAPPGIIEVVTFLLPPQRALFALESAFAQVQPIPWEAFAHAAGYGLLWLILAGVALMNRET